MQDKDIEVLGYKATPEVLLDLTDLENALGDAMHELSLTTIRRDYERVLAKRLASAIDKGLVLVRKSSEYRRNYEPYTFTEFTVTVNNRECVEMLKHYESGQEFLNAYNSSNQYSRKIVLEVLDKDGDFLEEVYLWGVEPHKLIF